MEQLQNFEGFFAAANTYYDWSGGQHFTQINDFYHYALVGMKAHGGEFIQDGALQLNDPIFEAVRKPFAKTAITAASVWTTAMLPPGGKPLRSYPISAPLQTFCINRIG